MRKLLGRGAWGSATALFFYSASINAALVLAAVTVTSTSGGNITSTGLASNRTGGAIGATDAYCASATQGPFSNGSCFTTSGATSGCSNGSAFGGANTWQTGTFAVGPGPSTAYLVIDTTSTADGSLNKLLCGNGVGNGCQVCICAGAGNTSTLRGASAPAASCTASGGEINPTCDADGNVVSVTSSLTLTCP